MNVNATKSSRLTKALNKNNVLIIGDSHARGCADNIKQNLDSKFTVSGFVKPGAKTKQITNSDTDIGELKKKDIVFLWAGMNDISKNKASMGILAVGEFIKKTAHTNVVVMAAPHRHDLTEWSCVNTEVKRFNKKVEKIAKLYNHATFLNVNLNLDNFTRHGLHLNKKGKIEILRLMSKEVINIINVKRNEGIPLTFPTKSSSATQDETKTATNNKAKEEKEAHMGPATRSSTSQPKTPNHLQNFLGPHTLQRRPRHLTE